MLFSIARIQTDRGAEFLAEEVQRRPVDEAIRFRPIPPRSPHLNGKVEGVQRTVLEEFWDAAGSKAADDGEHPAQWALQLAPPHNSLHGRSPIDVVCQLASQTPLWGEVGEDYDPKKERLRVRDHAVDIAL